MLFNSLFFIAFALLVSSNPDGAPGCVVNIPRITSKMAEPQDLGFSLSADDTTWAPGGSRTFTVNGGNFKGLLMFVVSSSDENSRVGNFVIPDGYKSNKNVCDSQGFSAGANGAITHSNPRDKPDGSQFAWNTDVNDICEPVIVNCVVATGPQEWQVVDQVVLTCDQQGESADEPEDDNSGDEE